MADDIQKLRKDYEEFVHIVAHDLSAPLRHVKDFTALLLDSFPQDMNAEQREYKGFIDKALSKLDAMQSDLLTLSRIATHEKDFCDIKISDVVQRAADSLNIAVICNAGNHRVWGDESQIELVFFHLFQNAQNFARPNIPLQIMVDVLSASEGTEIVVRDNGIGIAEKHYDDIFKIFRRLHPAGTHGDGTGAGLAIVDKIMSRHGGKVRVTARLGEGSSFILLFPNEAQK